MNILEIAGLSASVCVGISLGLIGGGGSILTLPILVYLLHINPVTSSAYSLFVVGTTSLVGAITYMRQRQVDYRVALVFSVPSFVAVYTSRHYLLPAIPESLGVVGSLTLTRNGVIMVLFSLLMLGAALSMIRGQGCVGTPARSEGLKLPLIAAEGALVGLLTGLVGAGGGFLIIPALVLLARLPMKIAVGTSLLIIAVKSLIGFTGDLSHVAIDWSFLLRFTLLSVTGIFIGSHLSRYISGARLKKSFGYFVLLLGVYILLREVS
ncbi:sulfite exporter TauE/SafE family protein [Rudanella lutea]|uniref:sulfite exporter TauE/SafE family protein n=1 Tax=Rudanella lutea TaxID=451374 RepID=UPI0003618794|nr:sulfite exporter TauE/SafE family protein [Rudanella lutea]